MNRPSMNMAKVAKCVKGGKSRSQCQKEAYPDKGKGKGKSSKGKKPARFQKKEY